MKRIIASIKILSLFFIMSISFANKANPNDEEVLQWATSSVISTYSYNALSYEKQMDSLKNIFTTKGWSNFEEALKKSGNLESVKKNQLVVTAYKTASAKIISFSKKNKQDTWVVKVPANVTYRNEYIKVEQQIESYVTITKELDKNMLIANINSSLTSPAKSVQAIPQPRANCNIAAAATSSD